MSFRFNVEITSICQRPKFDEFPRHFCILFRCNFDGHKINVVPTYFFRWNFAGRKIHVISRTFFDVNSMVKNSTLFSRIFFDLISMTEKSTLFPRTIFDVILLVGNSRLFPCTFFDVISIAKKSMWFPRTFFDVISMVEKSTLFPRFHENQKQPSGGVPRERCLKICSKFTGEHPCWSAISIEIALRHGCSPINCLHIFRTTFLKNTSGRLLLNFASRKIHVVSTYFFQCNFDGRNMCVVFTYYFRRNFDV